MSGVSQNTFDYYVGTLFDLLQPARVCDIGPGRGKYSGIARQKAKEHGFDCHLTAVEIDASYVEEFKLRDLYDEIMIDDAVNLIKEPRRRFDFVIIGDCIEHMRKSDGIDLINFLIYRTGYICIICPESWQQDDIDGHAAEAHISIWSEHDFRGMDMLHRFVSPMHAFLIKGYQPGRMTITG
jgi:23S rRNA U2552 (ribose-2'-O)-methylase RlmE/FtsJ